MLEIILDIDPPKVTAQQKGVCVRGGRPIFYKKREVEEVENLFLSLLKPYTPKSPLNGALKLNIMWVFPFNKTEKKSITKAQELIPHIVKPDLDNLEKSLLDCLTQGKIIKDDSIIFTKQTTKYFGPHGCIIIQIDEA